MKVARVYCENLTIEPTSKTTSVAVISLKNSSLQRGQDFINQLLEMYNRNTNNDKNEIAQKTARRSLEIRKRIWRTSSVMQV